MRLEALVGRRRAPAGGDEPFGRDVDVAVGAGRLDQAELGDVARDGRLGDLEALRAQRIDDLALAADRARHDEVADRPLALLLEVVAGLAVWPSPSSSCRARPGPPGVGGDARPEGRVGEGPLERVRARTSRR